MIFKILLPIILFISISCGKDDPTQPTDSAPQISLSSPANNSKYTESENISIQANITDDKEIYELKVVIKKLSNNSETTLSDFHVHATAYTLNKSYDVTTTDIGNYQIIIIVTDLDGNETIKIIDVVLNP
jgi:hypothetical protein